MKLGFIGTGSLTTAVVEGLCANPDSAPQVLLSPRNTERSETLATRHLSVTCASSNDEVVANADMLFLAVLPGQLADVLPTLQFREHQTIVNFVVGSSVEEIRPFAPSSAIICQVIPIPTIQIAAGPVLVYPPTASVESLFGKLGTVVVPDNKAEATALLSAAGMMSPYMQLLCTAVQSSVQQGVAHEKARVFYTSMFSALNDYSAQSGKHEFESLPGSLETPGGLNEHCRDELTRAGWYSQLTTSINSIFSKLAAMSART